jgi:hypothetical protein
MIVFKEVDVYDTGTGNHAGTHKVYSHSICDFTGERITDHESPNTYKIDYNSNDPCFGDGEGERWFYDRKMSGEEYDKINDKHHELFGQVFYTFKQKSDKWEGYEVFGELVKLAIQELDEIYSLDHLLRWSRGRMLEKVITSGEYKLEQFLED